MRLKNKVILVTGSTTGIGEGMVRVFAREGAKVMIHGRRKDAAQALAAELGEAAAFFCIGALDDPQVPARFIAETIGHFGRIDGLVNNAAAITRGQDTGILRPGGRQQLYEAYSGPGSWAAQVSA